jgi:hypothetical protein
MLTKTLDLTADIIDVRDIIDRIEELETEVEISGEGEHIAEWKALTAIMEDLKGNGGDEQWRGDWYPLTLILESYFVYYAQELAEQLRYASGPDGYSNPLLSYIDWEAWAQYVRTAFTSTEIAGATYWYR